MTPTFDIEAFGIASDGSIYDASCTGGRVTGWKKLVQRVIAALLQDPETVRYTFGRRNRMGTFFMPLLRRGELRSEMDVRNYFRLSTLMTAPALLEEETEDDPPDERYKDAELKRILVAKGLVQLEITIHSQSSNHTVMLTIAM